MRDIVREVPGWMKALLAALALLVALAGVLILAGALRTRRLERQRRALVADVGALQMALLPDVPARLGGLAVAVAYRPADGLAAGGDFYDVFPLADDRVGIIVGDVSGHGRDALRSATFARHMIRSYMEAGLEPRMALQVAGRVVSEHDTDELATVLTAVYDEHAGTLTYASAGHPPPIVNSTMPHEPLATAAATPIGVGCPTGLRQTTIPLPEGSAVWFFTDGLIEARLDDGELIGRARVEEITRELGARAGEAAGHGNRTDADELVARVSRLASIRDDVAVCAVRVRDSAARARSPRIEEFEVRADETLERIRRFLAGCGVPREAAELAVDSTALRAAQDGSAVLRVRFLEHGPVVDSPVTGMAGSPQLHSVPLPGLNTVHSG